MGRAAKLRDDAVDDMAACVAHLRQATGGAPVGVLGFCLGGRYALLLAAQERGLAACVAFYPSVFVPPKPNQARDAVALSARIACPVHLVYGTADEVLTHAAFLQLRGALEQRAAATIVQVHPGAVHSFMRPELQGNPANAAATRLAWPQAEAFLAAQLARS
jgi:carboxymethylenebutenolidase